MRIVLYYSYVYYKILQDKLCNVVIVPCGSDAVEINIDYVDSIICMDEGFAFFRLFLLFM